MQTCSICSTRSDHFPILLTIGDRVEYRKKRTFRYVVMWERDESCMQLVQEVWKKGGNAGSLQDIQLKIETIQKELGTWSAAKFGAVTRKAKELWKKLS